MSEDKSDPKSPPARHDSEAGELLETEVFANLNHRLIAELYEQSHSPEVWQWLDNQFQQHTGLTLRYLSFLNTLNGHLETPEGYGLPGIDAVPLYQQGFKAIYEAPGLRLETDGEEIRFFAREESMISIGGLLGLEDTPAKQTIELIRDLSTHLYRVAQIGRQVASLYSTGQALFELLEQIHTAAIVVDEAGRVKYANRPAIDTVGAPLETGKGLALKPGAPMIGELRHRDADEPEKPFETTLVSGQRALVKPMTREFGAAPLFLLLVHGCQRSELRADVMKMLFNMTRAEARLCSGLVRGETIAELSQKLFKSEHTIKTQLKGIYKKMGCKRQSELVSILFMSPAWWIREA